MSTPLQSTLPTGVGFIGLGNIGRPMAERLVDWPGGLWVYDIDADAVAALERLGAKSAPSPRDLAAHAGVICVMVRDDEQVRSVVTGPDGLLAGAHTDAVIVIHSTIRAETAAEMELVAAPHGVGVLDAPVSGGAPGARDGRLAVMCGGKDDAFAAAEPVLGRMGELVVHLGPVGSGTRAKLARNLLHFVAFTAATEAQRLAEAAGLDLVELGRVVRHTDAITGGPGAIMHRDTTRVLAADDPWRPILEHVVALGEKDLGFATELADELGVDVPMARLALERLGSGLGVRSGGGR
jgi:3-hydroxyisobutyrate dehydrogenase